MTEPESPSALLERAAARLFELAEPATPGPWQTDGRTVEQKRDPHGHDVATAVDSEEAAWIATMSPTVAPPLVEWLRAEAEYIEGIRSWRFLPPQTVRAVAFARVVLGDPENTP